MHGAVQVNDHIKSISAQKPPRPSGHQQRRKKLAGGRNVLWKRLTASFDDAVKQFAANPAIVAPLTRLVFFEHLTTTQGMAGRRYADIMRDFAKYHMENGGHSAKSANLEPVRGVKDQELRRRVLDGSMKEYEADARYAKRQHKRLMKALGPFADPITGRNYAKDKLDRLCLQDIEPESADRAGIAAILTIIAKEFGVNEQREKR